MARTLFSVINVLVRFGWALPVSLSVYLQAEWSRLVAQSGIEVALAQNSFPFIDVSRRLASIAIAWALIALAYSAFREIVANRQQNVGAK